MTKAECQFETWFEILSVQVLDRAKVDLKDPDSVREDYEQGRDLFDVADEIVADEIVAEYQD